jgi:hypothetical protein
MKVLLVGETWITHATHVRGWDSCTTTTFYSGADAFLSLLEGTGIEVKQLAHTLPRPRSPLRRPRARPRTSCSSPTSGPTRCSIPTRSSTAARGLVGFTCSPSGSSRATPWLWRAAK